MNDSIQNTNINDYLQNEPIRHFGDLDHLKRTTRDQEIELLIKQLRTIAGKTYDLDGQFLLANKLFSEIITEEMAQYDENLIQSYHFQQDFLTVFNVFYQTSKEKGYDPQEAESQAAKILWNYIKNHRIEKAFSALIKNRDQTLTPEKDRELLLQFKVSENLVRIVQRDSMSQKNSEQTAYVLISDQITKSIEMYNAENYEDMTASCNSALDLIIEHEGNEAGGKFAIIVGSLLRQKRSTVTEGLGFLKRTQSLYEPLGNYGLLADCHGEMAAAFWTQGMYKETLDNLASEIDLYSKQKNHLAVMYTEEKLSHFFRNLSRFNESQDWSLRQLNSAIRASDEKMKGLYFLDANLNYAQTLIGLNYWQKAEKHLNFAERTISHVELSDEHSQRLTLEINRMKGYISVFRGQFDRAKGLFDKRRELQMQLIPSSPFFSRFLRAEATLYRNLRNFSQAIKILQPLFQDKESLNPLNVVLLAELLALRDHESQALKLLNQAEKVFIRWNSIHALSRIYLSMGYIHFLTQDFPMSKQCYQRSLEITQSDLVDLKVAIDAHLNLAYMELEQGNLKLAERHSTLAEECAMMSGSKAFILDSNFLKASLLINTGNEIVGINALRKILQEAQELEIWFIQQKANYRLKELT